MFSWQNPVYDRQVALMGEDALRENFSQQTEEYNRALQDWQNSQGGVSSGQTQLFGRTVHDAPEGNGQPITTLTGRTVHDYPFPAFGGPPQSNAPINSVAPNNPPSGPTTIQDRPLPGVAGTFPGLPYAPRSEDLNNLLGTMGRYRENNMNAYANQMGGGYTGGVLPADMQQRFADGGQFRPNPTSGVRPNNPFSPDQASFGQPGQSTGASYGSSGGLGGLGGFGGSSPFTMQNPYGPR